MKNDLNHKLFMGFRGFMMRIPPLFSEKGAKSNYEAVSHCHQDENKSAG